MIIRTVAAAIAVAAALAPAASAQTTKPVSFSIVNNYEATIDSIFYGASSSEDWSDNILQENIAPGETVEITINDNLEECEYDLHYTFDNDATFTEMKVNLCEINGETHEFAGE